MLRYSPGGDEKEATVRLCLTSFENNMLLPRYCSQCWTNGKHILVSIFSRTRPVDFNCVCANKKLWALLLLDASICAFLFNAHISHEHDNSYCWAKKMQHMSRPSELDIFDVEHQMCLAWWLYFYWIHFQINLKPLDPETLLKLKLPNFAQNSIWN